VLVILQNVGWVNAMLPLDKGSEIRSCTYVAPELLCDDQSTPQSPLWCIGVLMYTMLAGYPPFSENTYQSLLQVNKKKEGKG
jgi:serine/threonine protein kinase